jgi:hypothetical protein
MACDVKRAHAPCPVLWLAFLTRLGELRFVWNPRRRANARRKRGLAKIRGDRSGSRIACAFHFRLHQAGRGAGGCTIPLSDGRPRPARSRPRRRRQRQDRSSPGRRAVEAHRFPERRPFIPGVHPTLNTGVQFVLGSGQGQSRLVESTISPCVHVSAGADGGPIRPSRFWAGALRDVSG